jgi:nucleotide-binding universal stress UspA family protein
MKSSASNAFLGTLLAPVDFSECSRDAVTFAVMLARRLKSRIILLHVVEPYLGTGDLMLDMARLRVNMGEIARKQLANWAKQIRPRPEVIVRIGAPVHEIIEAAKEVGASAIVIASHGRSAIGRFFLGGVAERVVRHADCPVILVPAKEKSVRRETLNQRAELTKPRPRTAPEARASVCA